MTISIEDMFNLAGIACGVRVQDVFTDLRSSTVVAGRDLILWLIDSCEPDVTQQEIASRAGYHVHTMFQANRRVFARVPCTIQRILRHRYTQLRFGDLLHDQCDDQYPLPDMTVVYENYRRRRGRSAS